MIAIVCSGFAVGFFVADRELNVQNLLMSLAALIAIATLFVPHMRHPNVDDAERLRVSASAGHR